MARETASRGFTLVEVVVAMTVLAASSLVLVASVASQQKMSALARERSIATNAIRAYVEAMRQEYPASGSLDMSGLLADTSTPADYIADLDRSAVRDARGLVLKMTDETGATWGPAAGIAGSLAPGALPWLWTDATMATVGPVDTGSFVARAVPWTWTPSSAPTRPSLGDLDSMGYVALGTSTVCGRDLDSSRSIANTLPATNAIHVAPSAQTFVPTQITLSWISGSSSQATRQRITTYAAFGPLH